MTYSVGNTDVTNTFDYWRSQTNFLAYAMSTYAVTVNSNTAAGNAAITGTFTANGLNIGNSTVNSSFTGSTLAVANAFYVGNTTSNTFANSTYVTTTGTLSVGDSGANVSINASSIVLANSTIGVTVGIPTVAQAANGQYYLAANGSWSLILQPYNPTSNGYVSIIGAGSPQLIDYYSMSSFNSADYLVSVKDSSAANNFYAGHIMTTHNSGDAYISPYGEMTSNSYVGLWSANSNTSHVRVYFTPSLLSCVVKYTRTIV